MIGQKCKCLLLLNMRLQSKERSCALRYSAKMSETSALETSFLGSAHRLTDLFVSLASHLFNVSCLSLILGQYCKSQGHHSLQWHRSESLYFEAVFRQTCQIKNTMSDLPTRNGDLTSCSLSSHSHRHRPLRKTTHSDHIVAPSREKIGWLTCQEEVRSCLD